MFKVYGLLFSVQRPIIHLKMFRGFPQFFHKMLISIDYLKIHHHRFVLNLALEINVRYITYRLQLMKRLQVN